MLRIFHNTRFDFIKYRKWSVPFSILLILITFVSIGYHSVVDKMMFNWSIEFVGGTLVQLKFEKPLAGDLDKIREIINRHGYTGSEIKPVGPVEENELLIIVREQDDAAALGDTLRTILSEELSENPFTMRRVEAVGPKIGGEMRTNAIIAVLLALIGILVYIWFRFQVSFGVASIVPVFHDVLITVGVFSLLDREFSLTFIAALLTIMGYSLNDTVVVFDRIRENMRVGLKGRTFTELINQSVNQTLARTVITSGTTFVVVTLLFLFGSSTIKDFALALMIGIVVGTYSSIYVAAPVLVWWHKKWPIIK